MWGCCEPEESKRGKELDRVKAGDPVSSMGLNEVGSQSLEPASTFEEKSAAALMHLEPELPKDDENEKFFKAGENITKSMVLLNQESGKEEEEEKQEKEVQKPKVLYFRKEYGNVRS